MGCVACTKKETMMSSAQYVSANLMVLARLYHADMCFTDDAFFNGNGPDTTHVHIVENLSHPLPQTIG
jgi:hypothetical protein